MTDIVASITNLEDIEDILANKSETNKELLEEIHINTPGMSGGHFSMNSNPKEVFYNFLKKEQFEAHKEI